MGRSGQRNGVAVAAEACGYPENVDFRNRLAPRDDAVSAGSIGHGSSMPGEAKGQTSDLAPADPVQVILFEYDPDDRAVLHLNSSSRAALVMARTPGCLRRRSAEIA